MSKRFGRLAGVLIAAAVIAAQGLAGRVWADAPKIGVFYFPGWKAGERGLAYADPWAKIAPYPNLQPLLGWYDEGEPGVMEQQLHWMTTHAIDYLVFDWYWDGKGSYLEHAIKAYWQAPSSSKMPYALMWANHDNQPTSIESFRLMVRHWAKHHLSRPQYLKVEGEPLIFVFRGEYLDQRARAFGSSGEKLLAEAQRIVAEKGLPRIRFVAGSGGEPGFTSGQAKQMGYSAYFAYNYHTGPGGRIGEEKRMSRSYAELDAAYRQHWLYFRRFADMPYVVPMTTGWDKSPWGGSTDPLHDASVSSPTEFKAHISAARTLMSSLPEGTPRMGVICCWNEFGEGSVLEPTNGTGFEYLNAVRAVFEKERENR
jgi:hypothetical protein